MKTRLDMKDLTKDELDLVILGKISALSKREGKSISGHMEGPRKAARTTFMHAGEVVCRKTFLQLHGVGLKRLKNLIRHYQQYGLTTRTHGNMRKLSRHALSIDTIRSVVTFLHNYSEQNGVVLPGCIPGYSRTDIQLLPSSVSKRAIWQTFQASASIHSTFGKLWRKLVPNIVTMKPMSDLCWTCQQNNTLVLRSVNRDEGEKEQALADALEHLRIVNMERTFYRDTLAECKSSVFSKFSRNGTLQLPPAPRAPLSTSTPVHYSFDYAQLVHFPSNPLQPGPIYFLTCRKCSIFGV